MIKKISTSIQNTYIPEWESNRSAPPGEQIRVRHKAVSVALKEELFPREFSYEQDNPLSKDMRAKMTMVVDRRKVIFKMTEGIDNCGYETAEGQTVQIKTAAQLFEAPMDFDPLIEELYNYYQGLLIQKVDEKN